MYLLFTVYILIMTINKVRDFYATMHWRSIELIIIFINILSVNIYRNASTGPLVSVCKEDFIMNQCTLKPERNSDIIWSSFIRNFS